jgi:hypothetical protein
LIEPQAGIDQWINRVGDVERRRGKRSLVSHSGSGDLVI